MIPATIEMLNVVMGRGDPVGAVALPMGGIGLVWGDEVVLQIHGAAFYSPEQAKRTLRVIARNQRQIAATQRTLDAIIPSASAAPAPPREKEAVADVLADMLPEGYTPVAEDVPEPERPEADSGLFDAARELAESKQELKRIGDDDVPDLPASLQNVTGEVRPREDRPRKAMFETYFE
jgi:hypothetical protein